MWKYHLKRNRDNSCLQLFFFFFFLLVTIIAGSKHQPLTLLFVTMAAESLLITPLWLQWPKNFFFERVVYFAAWKTKRLSSSISSADVIIISTFSFGWLFNNWTRTSPISTKLLRALPLTELYLLDVEKHLENILQMHNFILAGREFSWSLRYFPSLYSRILWNFV